MLAFSLMSKHWSWAYFFSDGALFRSNNITVPPLNPATRLTSRQVAVKVSIPLKTLFKYPTDATVDPPLEGMNKFWRGGIQNLDKEMEAYELLAAGEESTDEIPETPTIPVLM